MKIVADENMPFAKESFSTLGEVAVMSGRAMTREAVKDASILAVRSITKVNADLLEGTAVRFVGTATIGVDHVDEEYLKSRSIGFSSAPGSNADSVAEYITAALLTLAGRRGETLEGKAIGVVGCGNVGSRVCNRAEALGMRILMNDPPLRRQTGDERYLPLDALFGADFITLHVPLTREGPDATHHLADAGFLAKMKPGATLLNSSRGAVADGKAVKEALAEGNLRDAILDVWEGEPDIDFGLLGMVALGTPHIAGYSYDGKLNGTDMIFRAACRHFGQAPTFDIRAAAPRPEVPVLELQALGRPDEDVLREAVKALYDIEADDARLRQAAALPREQRGARFDELRKTYPIRREFPNTLVKCPGASGGLKAKLAGVGFRTEK